VCVQKAKKGANALGVERPESRAPAALYRGGQASYNELIRPAAWLDSNREPAPAMSGYVVVPHKTNDVRVCVYRAAVFGKKPGVMPRKPTTGVRCASCYLDLGLGLKLPAALCSRERGAGGMGANRRCVLRKNQEIAAPQPQPQWATATATALAPSWLLAPESRNRNRRTPNARAGGGGSSPRGSGYW
jgi:hypothetical protein